MTKKTILHAILTNESPTPDEASAVAQALHLAVHDPDGAVIVTRKGISIAVREVQSTEDTDLVIVEIANPETLTGDL